MTSNVVSWMNVREAERSNQERERETNRHNTAVEFETARANRAAEQHNRNVLQEQARHNRAYLAEQRRAAQAAEAIRRGELAATIQRNANSVLQTRIQADAQRYSAQLNRASQREANELTRWMNSRTAALRGQELLLSERRLDQDLALQSQRLSQEKMLTTRELSLRELTQAQRYEMENRRYNIQTAGEVRQWLGLIFNNSDKAGSSFKKAYNAFQLLMAGY